MNGTLSQNDPLAMNMFFFFFSCHREFQYIIGQVCRPWHLTLASMDIKLRLQCGPAIDLGDGSLHVSLGLSYEKRTRVPSTNHVSGR